MADNFENLEIWKRAVDLAETIYNLTLKYFPKNETFSLSDQIKRSVTSISANIAESYGRYHYKDRNNFLYFSRGSLTETRSHLLIAQRLFHIPEAVINPILEDIHIESIKLNNYINSISKG